MKSDEPIEKKILVQGPTATGKTTLCRRFCSDTFEENYSPGKWPEAFGKNMEETHNMVVRLWDISESTIGVNRGGFLKDPSGIVFVLDRNAEKFDKYSSFIHEEKMELEKQLDSPVPIVFAVTKSDLKFEKQTDMKAIEDLAKKIRATRIVECSAKTGRGVNAVFGAFLPIDDSLDVLLSAIKSSIEKYKKLPVISKEDIEKRKKQEGWSALSDEKIVQAIQREDLRRYISHIRGVQTAFVSESSEQAKTYLREAKALENKYVFKLAQLEVDTFLSQSEILITATSVTDKWLKIPEDSPFFSYARFEAFQFAYNKYQIEGSDKRDAFVNALPLLKKADGLFLTEFDVSSEDLRSVGVEEKQPQQKEFDRFLREVATEETGLSAEEKKPLTSDERTALLRFILLRYVKELVSEKKTPSTEIGLFKSAPLNIPEALKKALPSSLDETDAKAREQVNISFVDIYMSFEKTLWEKSEGSDVIQELETCYELIGGVVGLNIYQLRTLSDAVKENRELMSSHPTTDQVFGAIRKLKGLQEIFAEEQSEIVTELLKEAGSLEQQYSEQLPGTPRALG